MNNKSYSHFLKIYFFTAFVRLPLLTLTLVPVFFVLYGGEITSFWKVVEQAGTLKNVGRYFFVLIISYFGQATYGWIQARKMEDVSKKEDQV